MCFWSLYTGSYIVLVIAFLPLLSHWTENLYRGKFQISFIESSFFSVIPPLIYFPCSAFILKSSCSPALISLVLAESASSTSWAVGDTKICGNSSILTPAWPPAELLCHSVPGFNFYMSLLTPHSLLYSFLLLAFLRFPAEVCVIGMEGCLEIKGLHAWDMAWGRFRWPSDEPL